MSHVVNILAHDRYCRMHSCEVAPALHRRPRPHCCLQTFSVNVEVSTESAFVLQRKGDDEPFYFRPDVGFPAW